MTKRERERETDRQTERGREGQSDVPKMTDMSIDAIVEELDGLIDVANEGGNFDEDRMDELLRQRDDHPEYIKRVAEEKILFREQLEPFLYRSV